MNIKASKMTFCVTCVVDKIVVTHLRNPMVGIASDIRGVVGIGVMVDSSTRWRMIDDSNQKRHVIYQLVQVLRICRISDIPEPRNLPDFPCYC